MKLCQKCADGIGKTLGLDMVEAIADVEIISESDCEFWAHKELERILTAYMRVKGL